MNNLQEIERAVSQLSSKELAAFRAWFAQFYADAWDKQIEEDVAKGKLNTLAKKALQDLRAAPQSRLGWDEAFATMAQRHDDVLLDDGSMTASVHE